MQVCNIHQSIQKSSLCHAEESFLLAPSGLYEPHRYRTCHLFRETNAHVESLNKFRRKFDRLVECVDVPYSTRWAAIAIFIIIL